MVDKKRLWSTTAKRLKPYIPGEQPKTKVLLKLNTNENPYPPSPKVAACLQTYQAAKLRLYPDPFSSSLKSALAEYFGLEMQNVFVGNGSDEVLAMAFQAFFNSEKDDAAAKPIFFPDISYSFYETYAILYDLPVLKKALDSEFQVVTADYLASSGGVVLANPNAPTGLSLTLAEIELILKADPNRVVIIDEAYVDFAVASAVELIEDYANLVVVQTFSKARSLAGSRIGFALAQPALIEALYAVRDSFNSYTMNRISEEIALASLADADYFVACVGKIIQNREKLKKDLINLNFRVLDSTANFLFVSHPEVEAEILMQALREKGVLVRHFKQKRIENFLRLTIGTDEEMETFLKIISDILIKFKTNN